jgi:hypothetical protein
MAAWSTAARSASLTVDEEALLAAAEAFAVGVEFVPAAAEAAGLSEDVRPHAAHASATITQGANARMLLVPFLVRRTGLQ